MHRMLTVGILLAAKLMDDRYFNNAYYAKVSQIVIAAVLSGGRTLCIPHELLSVRMTYSCIHCFARECRPSGICLSCRYVKHGFGVSRSKKLSYLLS